MHNTLVLLIVIPFILGFITYGINQLIKPPVSDFTPVSIKISSDTMKQLQKKGFFNAATGKLNNKALTLLKFEVEKSKS